MTKTRFFAVSGFAFALVCLVFVAMTEVSSLASKVGTQAAMEIAVLPDQQQFTNPAVPVITVRTVSGRSDSDADSKKQILIKEVIIENRSEKNISSITVRWRITPLNSRLTTLVRGEFSPHELQSLGKTLKPGQRQTLKLSHPKLITLIQKIPNKEAMNNEFAFVIGVAEVIFEDGSTWKEDFRDVVPDEPRNQAALSVSAATDNPVSTNAR